MSDNFALQAEKPLEAREHRILSQGCIWLTDYSNVAYPSDGWWLEALVTRGYMQRDPTRDIQGPIPPANRYAYTVTRQGRDAYVSFGAPYVPLTLQCNADPTPGA